MYPRYAEINGKQYALNTDFRVAKECYRIINDETICDEERTLAVIYKIFGFVPKEYQKLKSQMTALTSETRKFKKESKDGFDAARKGAHQMGDAVKSGIKQMSKYGLAIFGARSAFYMVSNAIRGALQEIVFGTILCATGVGIPLGLAFIKQGLATIKSEEPPTWDSFKQGIQTVFEDAKSYIKNFGSLALGVFLCVTGVGLPFGLSLIKAAMSASEKGEKLDTGAVLRTIQGTWNNIRNYFNSNIAPKFTASYWRQKLDCLPQGFKMAINSVLSIVERGVNWVVSKLNSISFNVPNWVQEHKNNFLYISEL